MQAGFFDLDDRYGQLDKLGDPLPKLDEVVDWEGFRAVLTRIREKRSGLGRDRPQRVDRHPGHHRAGTGRHDRRRRVQHGGRHGGGNSGGEWAERVGADS